MNPAKRHASTMAGLIDDIPRGWKAIIVLGAVFISGSAATRATDRQVGLPARVEALESVNESQTEPLLRYTVCHMILEDKHADATACGFLLRKTPDFYRLLMSPDSVPSVFGIVK